MKQARNDLGQFKKVSSNGKTTKNKQSGVNRVSRDHYLQVIQNAVMSRSQLWRDMSDDRRDIDDECGYPQTEKLTADHYRRYYDRLSIAARVVEVFPKECWQSTPTVFETEDSDDVTVFEDAWSHIADNLQGPSWYRSEEGNPVWEYLKRIDILSGIGAYGVLLLGVSDGKPLDEPLEPKKDMELLFLRTFDESLSQITVYETDQTNSRFGKPIKYGLAFNDYRDQPAGESGFGVNLTTEEVHWTRVIHVADNLGSSEIFGRPRMRPSYNRLSDLRKLYGGSAEMYWRGAFPGLSFETHPQLGGDVEINESELKDSIEQYMNTLQRYITTSGMEVKSLAPQVVDPTPQIDTQIEAICIEQGIPKRIFTGSERGELASSQDSRAWNGRLKTRQETYLTPRLIVPFVDRLITVGVLPEPKEYNVLWSDLNSLTELEKADIALKNTEAMAKYVGGSVENMMHPMDFFTRILGLENDEAEAMLETVMGSEEQLTIIEEDDEEKTKEKETTKEAK